MIPTLQSHIIEQFRIAKSISRNPKFWLVWAIDIVLLVLALYFSFILRFDVSLATAKFVKQCTGILPIILCIKIPVFYFFGLYRGMWRYTSTDDLTNIIKATLLAGVLILVSLLYFNRFQGLSRSIFVLDALLTFLFISGHRMAIRYFYTGGTNGSRRFFPLPAQPQQRRLLLIGAGDAAEKILRELQSNPNLPYLPVGLVDDDSRKIGLKIHGIPVVGLIDDLTDHIERTKAQEILITIASASASQMKRFVELCQATQLPFKVIPGFRRIP